MQIANKRRPKGYVGIEHETIGSDVLAVLRTLQFPQEVLGASVTERLSRVDPAEWYPIDWMLELMEALERAVGRYGMIKLGRTLFRLSHEERAKQHLRSARDIIYGLDAMHHHANRGRDIGGWRVVTFDRGHAEVEKTTPHHCDGADTCRFIITSTVTGPRWG